MYANFHPTQAIGEMRGSAALDFSRLHKDNMRLHSMRRYDFEITVTQANRELRPLKNAADAEERQRMAALCDWQGMENRIVSVSRELQEAAK